MEKVRAVCAVRDSFGPVRTRSDPFEPVRAVSEKYRGTLAERSRERCRTLAGLTHTTLSLTTLGSLAATSTARVRVRVRVRVRFAIG